VAAVARFVAELHHAKRTHWLVSLLNDYARPKCQIGSDCRSLAYENAVPFVVHIEPARRICGGTDPYYDNRDASLVAGEIRPLERRVCETDIVARIEHDGP